MEPVSCSDFPGRVAATLFVGGCNFRCPWCHNGPLVCPEDGAGNRDPGEVLADLNRRRRLLDGVCISGGEPTLWEELPGFLRQLRRQGWATKLDTNGSRPRVLSRLLEQGLLDAVSLDFKGPRARYPELTGVPGLDTRAIEESMARLSAASIELEWRTTVLPDLHTLADMEEMARVVANYNHSWSLQPFRPSPGCLDPAWSRKPPCSPAFLQEAVHLVGSRFPHLRLGRFR